MKPQDLRNMTKDELNHKALTLKQDLSKFLFQAKTGTIENSASISRIKKDVARIKTILKEESYAK